MNTAHIQYFEEVYQILRKVRETQKDNILRAAEIITESLLNGGLLHTFGTGHSHIIAEEVFLRAGGLLVVNQISDPSLRVQSGISSQVERVAEFAKILLDFNDVQKGDAIIVVSNSGINALPVEMALESRRRGLKVVAITSLAHSRASAARLTGRHPTGKKLFEVADVVIDNCGVPGDAVLEIEGLPVKACPTSTVAGATIVNAVLAQVMQNMISKGVLPPVAISGNIEISREERDKMLRALDRWKHRFFVENVLRAFKR
jgi:uncharacterized phosphosugar-binding protein